MSLLYESTYPVLCITHFHSSYQTNMSYARSDTPFLDTLRAIMPEEFEDDKHPRGRSREPRTIISQTVTDEINGLRSFLIDKDGDYIMSSPSISPIDDNHDSSMPFTHSEHCKPNTCSIVQDVEIFAWTHGLPKHLPKRVHQLRGEWVERLSLLRQQDEYELPGPSPLREEVK